MQTVRPPSSKASEGSVVAYTKIAPEASKMRGNSVRNSSRSL
jgi:hypothetical protein